MKKIIFGLLIVAAGAGAYYLLSQQKNSKPVIENNSTLLLGKWKAERRVSGIDSSLLSGFQYEVLKNGVGLVSDSSAAVADSFYYAWTDAGELQISLNATDTAMEKFNVVMLNNDSLQLKDKENKLYQFTRM